MKRPLFSVALTTVLLLAAWPARGQDYPTPSIYPLSWELDFKHAVPERLTVTPPGSNVPVAYWYMTYTVTNNTDQERVFLPVFEMLTSEGQVVRSDRSIPANVFDAIKAREGNKFLEHAFMIGGEIRLGEDEGREGVAIWTEPMPEMGSFSIFVSGLSGETANVKGPDGKDLILRKTLQLNYLIRGDEVYPGEDEINENAEQWVMR